MRVTLDKKTSIELIESYNSEVSNHILGKASSKHLEKLRCEFNRRKWDYSFIANSSGEFNLIDGQIYLIGKKIFLMREYLLGKVRGEVVKGEITHRTPLWLNVRILAPFIGWENRIGLPLQALGTTRHFGAIEGNESARKYGLDLLIKSYEKVKIIDENIEIFVEQYDEFQKELKEVEKLGKSKAKGRVKASLLRGFYNNLDLTYGLQISISDSYQFDKIILAYKSDKSKIYLNQ
jgi:hypothetical protein